MLLKDFLAAWKYRYGMLYIVESKAWHEEACCNISGVRNVMEDEHINDHKEIFERCHIVPLRAVETTYLRDSNTIALMTNLADAVVESFTLVDNGIIVVIK